MVIKGGRKVAHGGVPIGHNIFHSVPGLMPEVPVPVFFETDVGYQVARRVWPKKPLSGRLCLKHYPRHFPDRSTSGSNSFVRNRCRPPRQKERVAEKVAFGPIVFEAPPKALPHRPTSRSNRFVRNRCRLPSHQARVAEKTAFGPTVFQALLLALPRPAHLPKQQVCLKPMSATKSGGEGGRRSRFRTDSV